MGSFVSYMLQVAVVMTLLYLAYKWFVSNTTFHRMNRILLLLIYPVSWLLPALPDLFVSASSESVVTIEAPVVAEIVRVSVAPGAGFDWWRLILWIYAVGCTVSAVWMIIGMTRLFGIVRSGRKTVKEGWTEIVTDRTPGPFSWWRYVVIRPQDCDDAYPMVIAHERTHLRLRHWLDLIPAQVTSVLQWFSPVAWLMVRDLRDVHEYEVDEIVAGENQADYQLMLLKKTVGSSFPVLADSLTYKKIKKRIVMMMVKKTSPSRRVAAIAIPAAAVAALFALSQPAVADVSNRISAATMTDISGSKVNESAGTMQMDNSLKIASVQDDEALVHKAITSDAESESVLEESVETEDANEANEEKTGKKPTYFVNDKLFDGELKDIDSSAIESVDVVKNDPAYPQGKIMVYLKGYSKTPQRPSYVAEKIAEFEGGMKGLLDFVIKNIRFPEGVTPPEKPIRVILQFTVLADGGVDDIRVMRSQGEAYDNEAIRVVRLSSGKWIPGENDGKPVATKFTLPITFSATSDSK